MENALQIAKNMLYKHKQDGKYDFTISEIEELLDTAEKTVEDDKIKDFNKIIDSITEIKEKDDNFYYMINKNVISIIYLVSMLCIIISLR